MDLAPQTGQASSLWPALGPQTMSSAGSIADNSGKQRAGKQLFPAGRRTSGDCRKAFKATVGAATVLSPVCDGRSSSTSCAEPRSALGPCRNGRVRASAVTSGHQRFRGSAGCHSSSSSSWDDASGRFGLWSRRSRTVLICRQSGCVDGRCSRPAACRTAGGAVAAQAASGFRSWSRPRGCWAPR
jgi:hypothetical protein